MYYPSSTTYTTQSYRKFKKQDERVEVTSSLQDYHIQRTQKQIEQLQKELEQVRLEHQNSEKQRRQAEEKLYKYQLKYDDMNKECLNLRERIAKLESEKTLIKAQSEAEIKSLNYQIQFYEQKKLQIVNESNQLENQLQDNNKNQKNQRKPDEENRRMKS